MLRRSTADYISPRWPDQPFDLYAQEEHFAIGPFTRDGWSVGPDGTLWDAPMGAHPVTLRVRRQEAELIFATTAPWAR